MATSSANPVLEYRSPQEQSPTPNPLLATLLHLPGSFCWIVFLAMVFGFNSVFFLAGFVVFVAWPLAAITALASLVIYLAKPKPWYVFLNLAVNISGLIFSVLLLAGL